MADELPQNMPELLSEIEREWKELWRVIARLTPDQMTTPDAGGWSPKDNLAHLTEWMKVLMDHHIDRRPAHEVLQMSREQTEAWDMEVINPVLFERNRARSVDDVVAELRRVHATLMLKLRSMPFDDLMKPRHAEDPDRQPVLLWVLGDTSQHFAEHRLTIEKIL